MGIGQNIKKFLKERDMNQAELAAASNLTTAAISRYVNDSREPTSRTLVKLTKALECTADELLEGME